MPSAASDVVDGLLFALAVYLPVVLLIWFLWSSRGGE